MLPFLFQDAIFAIAVALETVALTRLLSERFHIAMQAGLDPVFSAFQSHISDKIKAVTQFLISGVSSSYNDAYLISIILFFLFFIAQARRAIGSDFGETATFPETGRDRAEIAADTILPVVLCCFGAILTSFTLLPLFTPVAALWLLLKRAISTPSWFSVSRTFYANLIAVGGLTAAALYFLRA